jgi:hypothetical protein
LATKAEIEEMPGIVLYTLLQENLASRLEDKCRALGLPNRLQRNLRRSFGIETEIEKARRRLLTTYAMRHIRYSAQSGRSLMATAISALSH